MAMASLTVCVPTSASPRPGATLLHHGAVFLETIDSLAETQWGALPAPGSMLGCVVAGEGVKRRVEEQLELWDLEPRWVASGNKACGVVNSYDHPSRLGVDRWVALIGARHRVLAQGPARPALVVQPGAESGQRVEDRRRGAGTGGGGGGGHATCSAAAPTPSADVTGTTAGPTSARASIRSSVVSRDSRRAMATMAS